MNNQGNQSSRLQRTLEQDRILSISKVPYTKQNNKKTRYKSLILDLNHILFWYNHSLYYVFLYTKKVAKQTVSNYCVHKTPCNTRFYSIFGFMCVLWTFTYIGFYTRALSVSHDLWVLDVLRYFPRSNGYILAIRIIQTLTTRINTDTRKEKKSVKRCEYKELVSSE